MLKGTGSRLIRGRSVVAVLEALLPPSRVDLSYSAREWLVLAAPLRVGLMTYSFSLIIKLLGDSVMRVLFGS